MNFRKYYLLISLLLLGCKNEEKLTIEPVHIANENCADCPIIDITLPKVLDRSKVGRTLETSLREEVIMLLTFDEELEATTIDEAVASFNEGYSGLKDKFEDETAEWEAKINAQVSHDDKNLLTVHLDSYLFTGGAHGYKAIRYLNFDKKKGKELENWELFKNLPDFEKFAEEKFRSKENILKGTSINSTGFMFEKDVFYLPENMGFTDKGLHLVYNPYEVASYADGPIDLLLPYAEIKNFLAYKLKS